MKAEAIGLALGSRFRTCCRLRMPSLSVPLKRLVLAVISAVAVAAAIGSGCAGDPGNDVSDDPGPVHVHGLGVDPAGSSLYIATHTGLFRMERGSDDARRVGESRQDTMGFTVVGAGRFLGSGHPDLRTELPPLLGLIESTDQGRNWESVSLLGEADFHALRAKGSRVVGYDASGDRLMSSVDGGRTWTSSRPPYPLVDVAVHPGDPRRLVAASEAGVIHSRDGGTTWSAPAGVAVALAWPRGDALYALGTDGATSMSRDSGASWATLGATPGAPAALTAIDADQLVVALHEGGFAHSSNGGRSWAAGAWP